METPKANELRMPLEPLLRVLQMEMVKRVARTAMLRRAELSQEEIALYSQKLCNLIDYKTIQPEDVWAMLDALDDEIPGDFESAWPVWGRMRYAVERQSITRRSDATRKLAAPRRGVYEPGTVAEESPEMQARIAKLNARLKMA